MAEPPAAPADRSGWRLALFVAALVAVLLAGFGIGRAVGPGPGAGAGGAAGPAVAGPTDDHYADGHTHGPLPVDVGPGGAAVGGLAISSGGYTLQPDTTVLEAGTGQLWTFRIVGPDAQPVRSFMVIHEQPMHLVVMRRDLTGYQHLHPTMGMDGTWQTVLSVPEPGIWRAYADFALLDATGAQVEATLAVDLTVPGDYRPEPLPETPANGTVAVGDLTVSHESGLSVGASAPVLFRVFDDSGAPITEQALQPYLGAYGHLVVVRTGDLGYLHVHSEPALAFGAVRFWLAVPSPGSYRMFFEFQVADEVRRAEFTVTVP